MFNKNFYPTPETLAHRMFDKVNFKKVKTLLEPSAGKGDLIKALDTHDMSYGSYYYARKGHCCTIHAIEIEPDLRAILTENKHISVIDNDFLQFAGATHYDLIMANFPFSEGEHHLTKALDILFCGQLVCLVNAETLKNPCTNTRKALVNRLNKLNADIEYIPDAFIDAERKTGVEIALIYVNIKRTVEIDVFGEMQEASTDELEAITEANEVATKNNYRDLVARFNRSGEQVAEHLLKFYRNYKHVAQYLKLEINKDYDRYQMREQKDLRLTEIMRAQHNQFIQNIKKDYWEKVTHLPEVYKYLTSKQLKKMRANSETYYCKEFTESNIRQFVCNVVKAFPLHINEAILDLFELITSYALRDNRWRDDEYKSNIHYFNAWKSNSGYKVNKKIIVPFYYGESYLSCPYIPALDFLTDLEKVMRYFKPSAQSVSIADVCQRAVDAGNNRKIDTEYFYISIFKKGTIHVHFKDLDLLRRFNIEACKLKQFLPMDYADKPYSDLDAESQNVVDRFETKKQYKAIIDNIAVLSNPNILQLQKLA